MKTPLLVASLSLAVSLLLPLAGHAQRGENRFITTGKDAILLSPPVLAIPGQVDYAEWSPDGKYVLGARQAIQLPPSLEKIPDPRELRTEQALVLWNVESRKATELWTQRTGIGSSPQTAWLGGTSVAYALITQEPPRPPAAARMPQPMPERWLCLIDARKPSLRALSRAGEDAQLLASPLGPIAVLFSRAERSVQVFGADGRARQAVKFPEDVLPLSVEWTSDGRNLVVQAVRPPLPGKKEGAPGVSPLLVDTITGKVSEPEGQVSLYHLQAPALPIHLVQRPAHLVLENAKNDTSPLWLAATDGNEKQAALVTSHADWAVLSPKGDSILYEAEGCAFVVPLVRVSKELFATARLQAAKARLISNAKQIGLALHMYAADHDDRFPGAEEPVTGLLLNYTKTDVVFEGFVYTHTGGPLSDIKEPSGTVLGYIPAPGGGRIDLFADGHVTFKKDE